jgi:hypothetical protein
MMNYTVSLEFATLLMILYLTGVVSRTVPAWILSAIPHALCKGVQMILSSLFSSVEQYGTMPHICPTSR